MSNGQIFCRVEQKFPISADKRYRLERLIKDHIEPDKYPRGTICNLYFDTPDYLMIRNSIDAENYKEKLRLRSYGIPEDDGKVFLELKKKFDGVVYKRREIMTYSEAKDYIYTRKKPYDTQIMREIDHVMRVYEGLAPAAFLSYDRESFVGIHDDGFRITFDSNIVYRFEDVRLESGIYGRSLLPPDMYIMEIKVLGAIPMWLVRELSACEIYKGSYSKYGTAYTQMLSEKNIVFDKKKNYEENSYEHTF